MTFQTVLFAAASLMVLADTVKTEVAKSDKELLQGAWVLFAGARDGKVLTPEEFQRNEPEPLIRLVFSGDSCEIEIQMDEETTKVIKVRFVLEATREPKRIDFLRKKDEGNPHGIYTVDKDEFRLCYCNRPGERPSGFNTKADPDVEMLIFRRQKP